VVLGCTHYSFVRQLIQAAMGEAVQIVDTAEAVARHAASITVRTTRPDVTNTPGQSGLLKLQTTGDAERFQRFSQA
jgi:glutamate racemase